MELNAFDSYDDSDLMRLGCQLETNNDIDCTPLEIQNPSSIHQAKVGEFQQKYRQLKQKLNSIQSLNKKADQSQNSIYQDYLSDKMSQFQAFSTSISKNIVQQIDQFVQKLQDEKTKSLNEIQNILNQYQQHISIDLSKNQNHELMAILSKDQIFKDKMQHIQKKVNELTKSQFGTIEQKNQASVVNVKVEVPKLNKYNYSLNILNFPLTQDSLTSSIIKRDINLHNNINNSQNYNANNNTNQQIIGQSLIQSQVFRCLNDTPSSNIKSFNSQNLLQSKKDSFKKTKENKSSFPKTFANKKITPLDSNTKSKTSRKNSLDQIVTKIETIEKTKKSDLGSILSDQIKFIKKNQITL